MISVQSRSMNNHYALKKLHNVLGGGTMSLFKELLIRVIIIVSLTDIIEFYVIKRRNLAITPMLVIAIIVVTLVPLVINIWYCLHKNHIIP